MQFSKKLKMEEDFTRLIEGNPEFREALDIVERNSLDRIWLIGGFVYRNLAHCLYGKERPKLLDLDFLVEKPKSKIVLPPGWTLKKNSYGNPKFCGGNYIIDYVPLSNVNSILRRKLKPSFENYLTGTPLTVQSVGYDIGNRKLIGDIGIRALLNKTVEINNLEQAKISASKKHLSIEEFARRKAESLGFRALLP